MDLARLQYFKTVAETVSLRKAAELLHVTPSALSKAVKALEAELGARLVAPAGRGLALTEDGQLAYKLACRLLGGYADFLAGFEARKATERPLRVGSFSTFTTYFLGSALAAGLAAVPVEVRQLMPGEIEQALLDGAIDVGITYLPAPDPRLEYQRAARTAVRLYVRTGAFPGVDARDVPMVVPTTPVAGNPQGVRGFDGWPPEYYPRVVRFRIEGLEAALEVTRQGLCAGFFPRFLIRLHNECVRPGLALVELPLPAGLRPQTLPVYLVRRAGDGDDPAVRKLAKALRLACA